MFSKINRYHPPVSDIPNIPNVFSIPQCIVRIIHSIRSSISESFNCEVKLSATGLSSAHVFSSLDLLLLAKYA